jgi:hypothetical protein
MSKVKAKISGFNNIWVSKNPKGGGGGVTVARGLKLIPGYKELDYEQRPTLGYRRHDRIIKTYWLENTSFNNDLMTEA